MIEQNENDIRDIGRRREIPPDEPYQHGEPDDCGDDGEPCLHEETRTVRVYQERREVCNRCDRVLRTVIAP